jgi:hypothetical protein
MATPSTMKCAHPSCACQVGAGKEFCSDYCSNAVEQPGGALDERCQCGHSDCVVQQAQDRLDERDERNGNQP